MVPFVSDHLWTLIVPLLPPPPCRARGGRPRIDDRLALEGILFVLHTGISWRSLPQQLGYGSGMTCWRRLIEWQHAGVWAALHRVLLDQLHASGAIDWSRASLDSATIASPCGGEETGPDPTNRGKLGCKRHLVVDRNGLPLAVVISAANVHDSRMLEAAVDAMPGVRRGRVGRPRKRPYKLHADKGFDFHRCRHALYVRGIVPRIARRGVESRERLGHVRWVVERTLSWLNRFKRLKLRYERRVDAHLALLVLACALVCFRTHTGVR
ncbi:IS5 family transposase [Deinococcus sp. KSM4-11]|uniref:IS5 family transposase n=1 Tax=Deinococcus sp. KSM4-11 TaxID=2568654 RepID=UPI0010A4FE60|nr:IS5 family transposase [Deinococcus sp. KSM4-11]THF86282.1 IS5 family transposase [Deinococcus sp. KSM4-11]